MVISFFSCKKESIVDNKTSHQVSTENEKYLQAKVKLEEYRKQIKLKKIKGPVPLGRIQTALEYAGADLTAGAATWKYTKFLGSYGGAFALLGGLAGSTYYYIDKHYDYAPVTPTSTHGTYTTTDEFFGYLHNNEVLKTYVFDNTHPTTVQGYLDIYYPEYISSIADSMNLDPDSLLVYAPQATIESIVSRYEDIHEVSEILLALRNDELDEDILNYLSSLLTDVNDPLITDPEEIFDYIDLYLDVIANDSSLTALQREYALKYLNLFEYSYALWIVNV